MIPKEKLTRKIASGKPKASFDHYDSLILNLDQKRASSEEVKYDLGQPSSASFNQQRVLHKESDLLPISSAKRHLSSASFSNQIEGRHHELTKATSRKIAFAKHEQADADESVKGHAKLNVKEEADRLLGLNSSASARRQPKAISSLISTSAWRIGENLAQRHLKSEPETKSLMYQVQYNPRSNTAPPSHSPQPAKKPKRTECHLVQAAKALPCSSKATALVTSPQGSKNKSKPYDLNDIQKYIQSQKSKRLHDTKSEKEKQKVQDEERKKKLQELYRKQRLHAIKSAQCTNSATKLNNSNEKASCHNNSTNLSKVYEQDMSKLLMDRISHLLNDNDKLVEKQRKQILTEKNKARKKVDFGSEDFGEQDAEPNETNESSASSASASTVNNSTSATPKQTNQRTVSLKHDRLKKICSMALDLQTKLQQTKLKLFGFNPTDEEDMMDYYKKNDNTFVTSTKHEGNEENEFMDELDVVQFERVFKQDVRDNKNMGAQSYEDMEVAGGGSSGEEVSRPGVSNMRYFKYTLTPDLAARRIQHAYRLYRARRRAFAAQRPPRRLKKENVRPTAALKTDQLMVLNNQKDGYNFLNVYKKKSGHGSAVITSTGPTVSTSLQTKNKHEPSLLNYTDDFMTHNETKFVDTDRLSTIKSSLSSSSDSTSLSKYITSSKNSKHLKLSKSAETQVVFLFFIFRDNFNRLKFIPYIFNILLLTIQVNKYIIDLCILFNC